MTAFYRSIVEGLLWVTLITVQSGQRAQMGDSHRAVEMETILTFANDQINGSYRTWRTEEGMQAPASC